MRRVLMVGLGVLAAAGCAPANSDTAITFHADEPPAADHLAAGEGWSENTVHGEGPPDAWTETSSRPPIGPDEPWVALFVRLIHDRDAGGAWRAACEARIDAPPDRALRAEGTVTTRLVLGDEVLRAERTDVDARLAPGETTGPLAWPDAHQVGALGDEALTCTARFDPR